MLSLEQYAKGMSYHPREPVTPFDYDAVLAKLDGPELPDVDAEFWSLEAQLLTDILAWAIEGRNLSSVGARILTLVLYLRPELIRPTSLREISKLPDAPCRATLSKCLLKLEQKYGLRPSPIQKPGWSRERYRRSAPIGHEHRQPQ